MFLDDTSYKMILPSGVTELNIDDNFSPNNIDSFEIDNNSVYKTIDGVLYNSDASILYVLPSKLKMEKYEIICKKRKPCSLYRQVRSTALLFLCLLFTDGGFKTG